jgi:hypothetical protein
MLQESDGKLGIDTDACIGSSCTKLGKENPPWGNIPHTAVHESAFYVVRQMRVRSFD